MQFFTADTHFNHTNIIKHDHRPFQTTKEMDTFLIKHWNETISNRDTVYHLGDFCWRPKNVKKILEQLNGQIHLIKGNHDRYNKDILGMFASVSDLKRITIQGTKIIMCHYALRTWPGKKHGVWNLYGHSHGKLYPPEENAIDVGINLWNWRPASFVQIKELLDAKTWLKTQEDITKNENSSTN